MGTISVSLPSDGQTIDAADYNVPINTIVTAINGNLDSNNIAAGGVSTANLATGIQVVGKESNPYKFSVYRAAGQNVGTAATKVQFDTEFFDTNSNYDNATNYRYTAPVAGFYQFSCSVYTTTVGSGSSIFLMLYKNGAEIRNLGNSYAVVGFNPGVSGSTLLQLAANDYIEVFVGSGAAAKALDVSSSAYNTFSGFLVSAT